MGGLDIALIVIGVVVVFVVFWGISVYNKLVVGRNKVKNSFAQIDVQLKRRFDLIPNLVETVKGYASHEKSIWEGFAKARTMYKTAEASGDIEGMSNANNTVTSTLGRLMMVQEKYPELKADVQFNKMMSELTDAENKISLVRQFFNDVVLKYNNEREVFPASIIAGLFKFKAEAYFNAGEESREAPSVSFK